MTRCHSRRFATATCFGVTLAWLLRGVAFCLLALGFPEARAQAAQRIYELNGSYAETNGGSALVPNGGTLGATGYTFAAGQGPSVSNALANTGEYTIEVLFRISDLSSYRNLINFNNRTSDFSLYNESGRVIFYNYTTGNSTTTDFVVSQTHRLVVTRNATTKVTTAYVDGVQKAQITDVNNLYVASGSGGILHFFRDDGSENTAGFVDQIRIYHSVLTPAQVAALGQTSGPAPEIQLRGNTAIIVDGDATPSTTDHTDFGTVTSSLARSFTIENTGTAALSISSITASGAHTSQFVVSGAPSSIAAGSSATFTVTFTPLAGTGVRSATITVNNNDSDEAAYDFAIQGTANVTASALAASYTTGAEIPASAATYNATGLSVNFSLNYAPAIGTQLMVVRNTGLGFITGRFSNLAQGQVVNLSFGSATYRFAANYYGGTGNDLVLQWADRAVFGWGENGQGSLGNANLTNRPTPVPTIASGVLAGKTVIAISAGGLHSLALCSDGTIAAWGNNYYGQLGNNSTLGGFTPVAVNTSGALAGKTVIAISAAYLHSMALCSDGTVITWGFNGHGQLGTGNTTDSPVPVAVTTGTGALAGKTVVAIASGTYHSMAVCSDGTFASWGYNAGQFGNGSFSNSSVPVSPNTSGVLAGKSVIAVSASFTHMIALCTDGTLIGSGANTDGQLGNGATTSTTLPVLVNTSGALAGKTVIAIDAGESHSVALCSDGTVVAWGKNTDGQLGNGTTTGSSVPVVVSASGVLAGKTPVTVTAGVSHSLALCSDGSLAAWGSNSAGQLGNNTTTSSSSPVLVSTSSLQSGSRFVATSASISFFSLGIVATPPLPPPAITAISPNHGSVDGGRMVTITGTGFSGATSVTFAGTAATSYHRLRRYQHRGVRACRPDRPGQRAGHHRKRHQRRKHTF